MNTKRHVQHECRARESAHCECMCWVDIQKANVDVLVSIENMFKVHRKEVDHGSEFVALEIPFKHFRVTRGR